VHVNRTRLKPTFKPYFEQSRSGDNHRFLLILVPEVVVGSIPTADYRPLRIGGDPETHTTLEPP
jgi:hypothetical protein